MMRADAGLHRTPQRGAHARRSAASRGALRAPRVRQLTPSCARRGSGDAPADAGPRSLDAMNDASPPGHPAPGPSDPPGGRRAHRPLPVADPGSLLDEALDRAGQTRAELASSTAAAVLGAAGRVEGAEPVEPVRLLELSDAVGLDTLAQLWRDSPPDTLPGALWALYVLRAWCRANGEEVARLWRAGRALAPADEVVAGVSEDADPQALETLADAVLGGVYGGDLAVALERAASFFRVVAAGRRATAPDAPSYLVAGVPDPQIRLAERNDRVAAGLARAATLWRVGRLH
jgi:hypothetical protein